MTKTSGSAPGAGSAASTRSGPMVRVAWIIAGAVATVDLETLQVTLLPEDTISQHVPTTSVLWWLTGGSTLEKRSASTCTPDFAAPQSIIWRRADLRDPGDPPATPILTHCLLLAPHQRRLPIELLHHVEAE